MSPVGRDEETAGLIGEDQPGDVLDDHEDKIGQALVDMVRKEVVIVEQVVGIGGAGRVGLY